MRGAVREEEEEEEVLGMWAGALSCDASEEREWMRVGGGRGKELESGCSARGKSTLGVRAGCWRASLVARPLTRHNRLCCTVGGPKGA